VVHANMYMYIFLELSVLGTGNCCSCGSYTSSELSVMFHYINTTIAAIATGICPPIGEIASTWLLECPGDVV